MEKGTLNLKKEIFFRAESYHEVFIVSVFYPHMSTAAHPDNWTPEPLKAPSTLQILSPTRNKINSHSPPITLHHSAHPCAPRQVPNPNTLCCQTHHRKFKMSTPYC